MKKALSVMLIFCFIFIGSSCGSQQQPVTKHIVTTSNVYWVASGKVYHIDKNCTTLSRSKNIQRGTPAQAKTKGKLRLCDVCGKDYIDDTNS